ncbi:MAG: Eco57I restriction-modification methylase domain-containing protein [Bacteroidales bacterium]|nr:Eco57I restriction-modification methylase domain-containing protein [Bacteroidales bacterium]
MDGAVDGQHEEEEYGEGAVESVRVVHGYLDEAHEGIEAAAGVRVMEKLKKENTRILSLSGTPFNLLDKYDEGEIYTWDYVMEQKAKQEWDDKHFGDPNPYADLPRMQILTFTLPKMIRDEAIENNEVFKFHEFFRVWTEADRQSIQKLMDNETNPVRKSELKAQIDSIQIDKFIHEGAVRSFVKKLRTTSTTSQYPFSTDEFRDKFRHTFWLLPGVKEAAALEQILREDNVFGRPSMFHIINAAGDGNIEDKDGSALADVEDNIRGNQEKNITAKKRTITLSCGKLTTGVSVPEWTAVLCMKGSENTPAANYMQTIFRVQTHATLNGRQKSDCYVFDFAPDRALTAVAETAKMAVDAMGAGKKQMKRKQKEEEEHLQAFIKLCPVLSMDEGEMGKHFSANQIFEKLSNVYIERAVRSGYADNSLYNPEQLMNLTPEQEKALGDVHDLLGSMPASWKPEKININTTGIGTGNGDQIMYVYYLTSNDTAPTRPSITDRRDENGFPIIDDAGWDKIMNAPTKIFPYLYVSSSRFIDGGWTSFSNPSLWKKWFDRDSNKPEDQIKKEQENKEKRARMSVLRGVSIRIPLLVYGAEINDDAGEEITIDNFASDQIVDDASWEEFMPKGFTKETFNILKDCFDRSIFTGAAKRIRQMVKEADNLNTEDRINKIATIFSYFHNPDKETVLTPWRVVNMHMSESVGGWSFLNEEFDGNYTIENEFGESVSAARFVNRGDLTESIFNDYNARILEINSKTGLYPLYMAYSMFKGAKEPEFRKHNLTGLRGTSQDAEQYYHQAGNDLEIWKDVLQDNIFVVCRTKMAVSITKRTLAGFRTDIRMNVRCYEHEIDVNELISANIIKPTDDGVTFDGKTYYFNERKALSCDMINVLRVNPSIFLSDIVKGKSFWNVYNSIPLSNNEDINNMRFKAVVGNPPYQISSDVNNRNTPIYHYFYEAAEAVGDMYCLISPARFLFNAGLTPPEWNEKMLNDCHVKVVKYMADSSECFPNNDIKGGIAIVLRNHNEVYQPIGTFIPDERLSSIAALFDPNSSNNLNSIIIGGRSDLKFNETFLAKYPNSPADRLAFIQIKRPSVTQLGPNEEYELKSSTFEALPYAFDDIVSNPTEYYHILGLENTKRAWKYVKKEYLTPRYLEDNNIDSYKVFVPKANGSGKFGETLSRTEIGCPDDSATPTFISIGKFRTENEALNCATYLKTKFLRCLLGILKKTQDNPPSVWSYIPLQDFTSSSDVNWNLPINEIDKALYKKYHLTETQIDFIENNVCASSQV